MSAKAKPKGDRRRSPSKKSLTLVQPQEQTFKTQEGIDAALRRSILNAGVMNGEGVIEASGVCHGSNSDKALQYDMVSLEVRCLKGCDYERILRTFGLPTQPQADKADSLERLRKELGVPFKRISKLGNTKGVFDAELDDGLVFTLGGSSDVLKVDKVEAAIADATHIVIPAFSKAKWRPMAQLIFNAAEVVETFSEEDETRSWVRDFVRNVFRSGVDMNDKEELFKILRYKGIDKEGKGFVDTEKRVYVSLDRFTRYVNNTRSTRVSEREAAERLSRVGFVNEQVGARQGAETASRRFWISPPGFLEDGDRGRER